MIDTERNLLTLRGEKIDELVTSVVVMKKGMPNDDWPEETILLPPISRERYIYSRSMPFRPKIFVVISGLHRYPSPLPRHKRRTVFLDPCYILDIFPNCVFDTW